MRCAQTELLLAGYAAEDLSPDDRERVDEHVRACATCAASLVAYRELEGLLLEHHLERTPATWTARQVVRQLGLTRRRGILGVVTMVARMAAVLTGLPGIIATSLVGAGILLSFAGDSTRRVLTDFGNMLSQRLPAAIAQLPITIDRAANSLNATTNGQEWLPLTVYLSLFLVIAAAGSWMVLKFVRE